VYQVGTNKGIILKVVKKIRYTKSKHL